MGKLTPEAGGDQGTPHNQDHEHFKALKEDGRLRPNSAKPKEIFRVFYGKPPAGEVPGDASTYLSDPHFSGFARRGRLRPAVFGGHERPSQHTKPNPAEQQATERLGKRPPEQAGSKTGLEHDPALRGLAKELFGGITDQAASEFIAMAVRNYPDLAPDEALREFDRESREGPFSGFTFP
jgi:hypothetical protein